MTKLPAVKVIVHRKYVVGALYTCCCNAVYINEVEVTLQCVYKYMMPQLEMYKLMYSIVASYSDNTSRIGASYIYTNIVM